MQKMQGVLSFPLHKKYRQWLHLKPKSSSVRTGNKKSGLKGVGNSQPHTEGRRRLEYYWKHDQQSNWYTQ